MKKTFLLLVVTLLLVVGGGAFLHLSEAPILDGFYSPEQQEARQTKRLLKEFPATIENFALHPMSADVLQIRKECIPSGDVQICYRNIMAEYREVNGNNGIFVSFALGANDSGQALKTLVAGEARTDELMGKSIFRVEHHELGWFPVAMYDFVLTQEGKYTDGEGTVSSYSYPNTATGNNSVTKYFIEKYAPAS